MIDTISKLTSEIRQLENTILHCENEILRRRIAIQEMFRVNVIEKVFKEIDLIPNKKVSVNKLIESILPLFDGGLITIKAIKDKLSEVYPTEAHRFYNVSSNISKCNLFTKVKGGYQKV